MGIISTWKRLLFEEQTNLRECLLKQGPFDHSRNLEIYEHHFKYVPNRLRYLLEAYRLDQMRVLDIGAGYGQFLVHFGPGSVGVDLNPERQRVARALGLLMTAANFEEPFPFRSESFDAAWLSNVYEHVVAPYGLLMSVRRVLKPGGLIFIGIPTVPANRLTDRLRDWLIGGDGYRSMEHVNGYTFRTAKFMIERALFRVVESNVFITRNRTLNLILRPVLIALACQVVIVARKDDSLPPPRIYPPRWLKERAGLTDLGTKNPPP